MTTEAQESPFSVLPGPVDYGSWGIKAASHILRDLCEHAAAAVSRDSQRPDLACFQVTVADGVLQVAATDIERVVLARTEAVTVTGNGGRAYIPARKLLAILKEIQSGDAGIAVAKNAAVISAAGPSWTLKLPSAHAYPVLPVPSELQFAPYPAGKLLDALRSVKHAVCREGALANLTQVQVAFAPVAEPLPGEDPASESWVTASDGNRLARAWLAGFPAAFCIPEPALDDVLRLLAGFRDAEAGVAQTQKHIAFRAGHVVYAAVKRMTLFPDMDSQLLNRAVSGKDGLSVDRDLLAAAVRRVRITADAETAAIALQLGPTELVISSSDEGNSAAETVPCAWKGDPGRLVVVSHVALSEALAAHPQPVCEFRLGPDAGKRRSPVYLAGGSVIQVLSQMLPALAGF